MDLGRFMRSRLQLGLWLGVPVLLILAATIPSLLVLHNAREGLRKRQVLMEATPALEVRLRKASDLLTRVTPPAAQIGSATETATRRLDQAAQLSGLTLRSVNVEDQAGEATGFKTLRFTATVQGSLRSVVKWLDEVQKPGLLFSVYSSSLQALAQPPDETFAGDVVLVLHLRTS